jgi:hypothetical protein
MKIYKPLLFLVLILPLSACETEGPAGTFFAAAGKKYEVIPAYEQCRLATFDCLKFTSDGRGLEQSRLPGISLILFTEYADSSRTGLTVTLNLYGVDAGKYDDTSAFCDSFKIKSNSLIQSSDGAKVAVLTRGSELEITRKSKNVISGHFKLKIAPDEEFLNDSLVVGEFNNIPLQ